MSATALDLQSFYPDALKITGVEETAQENLPFTPADPSILLS